MRTRALPRPPRRDIATWDGALPTLAQSSACQWNTALVESPATIECAKIMFFDRMGVNGEGE
jgi:hypothetical protein